MSRRTPPALRELLPADLVFTNHVLMGAPVGLATGVPFRVKAHGSELEYSMRGRPALEAWGRETLGRAEATYVGSQHIRRVLEDVVGHVERVHEVPPGVDVDEFIFEERGQALAALISEARSDRPNVGNAEERLPDEGNADRVARFFASGAPTVLYFGKLIEQKGVQVLLEAMPRRRRAARCRRLRPRARPAGAGRPAANALHRPARPPPSRPPAGAGRRDRRPVDLSRGFRDGRRRSRGRRLPAARRAPLGPG